MSYLDSFELALPDIKRGVDGVITEGILKIIGNQVATIASSVKADLENAAINHTNHIKYHYLKGGNSIKVLDAMRHNPPELDPSGDWDFQLIPDDLTYAAWQVGTTNPNSNPNLKIVSKKIIDILQNQANQLMPDTDINQPGLIRLQDNNDIRTFLTNDATNAIKSIVAGETAKVNRKRIAENKSKIDVILEKDVTVAYNKNPTTAYHVGLNYQCLPEWGIWGVDERPNQDVYFDRAEQRLKFEGISPARDITFENPAQPFDGRNFHPYVKPTIYVNNTIAGFLLFRLALVYTFNITLKGVQNPQPVNFKSEVVDISIPRMGSHEAMISVKDQMSSVIEYPPAGHGLPRFKVPGWRYHLIENLNLIGEIELGISGSPHKRHKRIKRVGEAFSALERLTRAAETANPGLPNHNGPMTMKALSERHQVAEIPVPPANPTDRGKSSIVELIYDSLMAKSTETGSGITANRPHADFKEDIKNNIIGMLGFASPVIKKTTDDDNVTKLMETLPYLQAGVVAPLTFNKIDKALRLLLKPKSSISGESNRFRIALDALTSMAIKIGGVGDLEHPLGIVRIDINQAGYMELRKKRDSKANLVADSTSVKKIEEIIAPHDANNPNPPLTEILVTLVTDYHGKKRASTTHLHFKYNANLDPVNVGGEYANDYMLVNNEFWKNQVDYCKAYRIKKLNRVNNTTNFDLLFLDYLSQVLMIHLRSPLIELYSKYKNP